MEHYSHGFHRLDRLLRCCLVRLPSVPGGAILGLVVILHRAHRGSGCGSFAGAALAQPTQLEAKSGDGTSLSRSEAEFVAGLMLKDKRKMYRDV